MTIEQATICVDHLRASLVRALETHKVFQVEDLLIRIQRSERTLQRLQSN